MAFNQASIDDIIIVLVSILCYFGKKLTNLQVSFLMGECDPDAF
jgi:hypothetical protein